MSDEDTMVSMDENRPEAGGTGEVQNERLVPVSEAIRYRKRAQAAEKELSELKELHDTQARELEQLKEQVEAEAAANAASMTQGVKETRTGGARNRLEAAATRAAESGKRADVQEYLRLRRNYV